MINLKNGNIEINCGEYIIARYMMKPQLISVLGSIIKDIHTIDNGYAWIVLKEQAIGKEKFDLMLFFRPDDHIENVHLFLVLESGAKSWDDWSMERECKRKELHDKWLQSMGINKKKKFLWGEVASYYDSNGGASYINVKYTHCFFSIAGNASEKFKTVK